MRERHAEQGGDGVALPTRIRFGHSGCVGVTQPIKFAFPYAQWGYKQVRLERTDDLSDAAAKRLCNSLALELPQSSRQRVHHAKCFLDAHAVGVAHVVAVGAANPEPLGVVLSVAQRSTQHVCVVFFATVALALDFAFAVSVAVELALAACDAHGDPLAAPVPVHQRNDHGDPQQQQVAVIVIDAAEDCNSVHEPSGERIAPRLRLRNHERFALRHNVRH